MGLVRRTGPPTSSGGGRICRALNSRGVFAIAALISPYESARKAVRSMVPGYTEVYVHCPVEVCRERDVKGLYGKASKGEIVNLSGVTDIYEKPKNPEIVVNTHKMNVDESVNHILSNLRERRLI